MYQHQFHPTILRAYDIRGIIGKTLFAEDAYAIGAGFAQIIKQKSNKDHVKIAVGYDGRTSSPMLAEALVSGLVDGGAEVISIGMGPTPMLYFADITLDCDGAIQITGSHNPKDYNGFKMVAGHKSFFADDIQTLGAMMAKGIALSSKGSHVEHEIYDDYIARLSDDAVELDGQFV